MHAEVIAIGDELTSGQRLDTNSQWISLKLAEMGMKVVYHSTVGDELAANIRVFREAFDRAEVVVCTGGLGPTADDLTREAMAAATGRPLVQYDDALEHVRSLFARRGRPMPEKNVVQAMFPEGATVIPNPHGSAPGIQLEIPREGRSSSFVFALPGVPAEMKEMFDQTVAPFLHALAEAAGAPKRMIRHRRIKCFGVGESDLEQMLPDLIRRGRRPSVGITVHKATITLRVTADGQSEQQCHDLMAPTIDTIGQCLHELAFGEEDDELQHVVLRLLEKRNKTLSTSAWTGVLSNWLTEADDSGRVFQGGVVLANSAAFASMFAPGKALEYDINTPQAAALAATRCREMCDADFGLALGAFPTDDRSDPLEPTVQTDPTLPVVHGAIADRVSTSLFEAPFTGHPDILVERAVKHALNILRLRLLAD